MVVARPVVAEVQQRRLFFIIHFIIGMARHSWSASYSLSGRESISNHDGDSAAAVISLF
jgi:hypothetical protein